MSRSDDYVTVTAILKQRTANAVLLDVGDGVSRGGLVPRSCLHAASDQIVDAAEINDEVELRMREWVAEDKGLL